MLPKRFSLTRTQLLLLELVKRCLREHFDATGEVLHWRVRFDSSGQYWKFSARVRKREFRLGENDASVDTMLIAGRIFTAYVESGGTLEYYFEMGVHSGRDMKRRGTGRAHCLFNKKQEQFYYDWEPAA